MTTKHIIKDLPEHANEGERLVCRQLIRSILDFGCQVSINDGDEMVVRFSTDLYQILSNMGSTGEDQVVVLDSDNKPKGSFYLVYDNGSEDEPMVVISDYTDSPLCNSIYEDLYSRYG